MQLNQFARKILAAVLSMMLVVGIFPASAFAYGTDYRVTKQEGDVMSLEVGGKTYFFGDAKSAFDASKDENLNPAVNAMTLKVLAGTSLTVANGDALFAANSNVTVDLNGQTLTLTCDGGSVAKVNVDSATTTIIDTAWTAGNAVDGTLNGGKLVINSAYLNFQNAANGSITIKNVQIEATEKGYITSDSTGMIDVDNGSFTGSGGASTLLILRGANGNAGTIKNTAVNTDGKTGLDTANVVLENNNISAKITALKIYFEKPGFTTEIKSGTYTGGTNAVSAQIATNTVINGGKYTGNIFTQLTTGSVTIKGGYIKGKLKGSKISADHCEKIEHIGDEYDGYTEYRLRNTHTATVSMIDDQGMQLEAASLSAKAEGVDLPDLITVWAGEEITYTLECKDDFAVTKITYNAGDSDENIVLDESHGYKTNGSTVTYTMTVPDSDYSLKFTFDYQASEGTPVAEINGKQYNSLSAAVVFLQDGQTLKLLDSITYNDTFTFEKVPGSYTLDLNGKTLTFSVDDGGLQGQIYGFILSSGSLTIKDESYSGQGKISFGGNNGMLVGNGTGASLTLESGTITGLGEAGSYRSINCTDPHGTVTLKGGLLEGRIGMDACGSVLNIQEGAVVHATDTSIAVTIGTKGGTLNMTGGEIVSGADVKNPNATIHVSGAGATGSGTKSDILVNISGGKIVNEGVDSAIYVGGLSKGIVKLSGSAEIVSEGGSALKIAGENKAYTLNYTVQIEESIKLKGATYAVELIEYLEQYRNEDGTSNMAEVIINGGYFACGDDYLPISDTYYVTYPSGKVLDTKESTQTGYYTLTEISSLSGHNDEVNADYTYQDFDGVVTGGYGGGLNQILESAQAIYAEGNESNKYPSDAWSTFEDAYKHAKFLKENNRNANQTEIDYYTVKLSKAIQTLESSADLDVNDLADGIYSIDVQLWKYTNTGASMADDALNGAATLVVDHSKSEYPTLYVHFKPTYQSFLYGHLLDMWLYNGKTLSEAEANAEAVNEDRTRCIPGDFYKHDGGMNAKDATIVYYDGIDKDTLTSAPEGYPYPGTFSFELPYLGVDTEHNQVIVRMTVDAMSGDATARLILKWSTLTPIEVKPTLTIDTDDLTMLPGEKQTVTAALKGSVSEGYTVSKWESDNDSVATVNNGEITAVGAGTCTITVTATKAGAEDLVKTIKVTVVPEGSTAVDVQNVTSSGSGESAELSGNALLTGGSDRVTVDGNTVTFNVKSDGTGITSSKVVIDAETAKALEGKTAVIQTNTGTITLDSALLAKIAAAGGKVTLSISKTDTPDSSLGQFSAAYAISLIDANGKAVDFGSGKATVAVPVSENVSWAYCIADGKRTDRAAVAMNNGTATFTVSHFSVWALSSREYEVGGGSESKFFLEDGNYYVDVYLWKEVGNEASMGDIAFRNNRKALVTVKNGKITRVQIATNPVFIDPYYSAIISFKLADGTEVTIEATGDLTTLPAGKNYTYIKLVSFDLPESAQPDIRDAVTYVPVIFYVPDTPMDAAVGEDLVARLRFEWSTATKVEDEKLNPDDDTASDTESVVLKDEKTGIVLETNTGILDKNATLSVDVLTKGSDYDFALRALSDVDAKWSLYNIVTLLNGAKTDPSGAVVLRIPCSNADGYVVYLINADGSKTKLNGSVQDGYFVVRTRSLGLIAVGTANSSGNNDNPGNPGTPGNPSSPQTGDDSHLAVWMLLMLASGAALIVLTLGRKRRSYMGK